MASKVIKKINTGEYQDAKFKEVVDTEIRELFISPESNEDKHEAFFLLLNEVKNTLYLSGSDSKQTVIDVINDAGEGENVAWKGPTDYIFNDIPNLVNTINQLENDLSTEKVKYDVLLAEHSLCPSEKDALQDEIDRLNDNANKKSLLWTNLGFDEWDTDTHFFKDWKPLTPNHMHDADFSTDWSTKLGKQASAVEGPPHILGSGGKALRIEKTTNYTKNWNGDDTDWVSALYHTGSGEDAAMVNVINEDTDDEESIIYNPVSTMFPTQIKFELKGWYRSSLPTNEWAFGIKMQDKRIIQSRYKYPDFPKRSHWSNELWDFESATWTGATIDRFFNRFPFKGTDGVWKEFKLDFTPTSHEQYNNCSLQLSIHLYKNNVVADFLELDDLELWNRGVDFGLYDFRIDGENTIIMPESPNSDKKMKLTWNALGGIIQESNVTIKYKRYDLIDGTYQESGIVAKNIPASDETWEWRPQIEGYTSTTEDNIDGKNPFPAGKYKLWIVSDTTESDTTESDETEYDNLDDNVIILRAYEFEDTIVLGTDEYEDNSLFALKEKTYIPNPYYATYPTPPTIENPGTVGEWMSTWLSSNPEPAKQSPVHISAWNWRRIGWWWGGWSNNRWNTWYNKRATWNAWNDNRNTELNEWQSAMSVYSSAWSTHNTLISNQISWENDYRELYDSGTMDYSQGQKYYYKRDSIENIYNSGDLNLPTDKFIFPIGDSRMTSQSTYTVEERERYFKSSWGWWTNHWTWRTVTVEKFKDHNFIGIIQGANEPPLHSQEVAGEDSNYVLSLTSGNKAELIYISTITENNLVYTDKDGKRYYRIEMDLRAAEDEEQLSDALINSSAPITVRLYKRK